MPYDELGNYIPGDDAPSIDEMKYELAKKEERRKAAAISDLLDKYVSDPIRGVSTAGAELVKRLPGADLAQAAMNVGSGLFAPAAAVPYSIYKGIESGEYGKSTDTAGRQFEDTMRELTYEPRTQGGRDIMEGIAKAIEVTKLPPYIGHIYSPRVPISADDVRVLAKRGIETGREIKAIPEDFLAAQQGLRRESNLGGTTYGAKLQGVAEDIGDVAARRAAMRADEGRVTRPGSVDVFSDLVPETNLYAVKPTGGQLVKSIDPVTGNLREVPDSSVAGISDVYENIRKQTEGPGLINQYLRTFVNRPGMQEVWEDFNAKKVAEEFPKAPTPSDARDAFQVKYPTQKARNDRMITFFDEFATSPEAQAVAADLGIKIPTFEDYQKRIEAANTWAQKGFANYIQKYVGAKEDPALQLATQGITFKPPERLTESATDALNYASPTGLREDRVKAGFSAEGEVQPFLKEKLTELKAVDGQLREMVTRRNALYEEARTQNIDPAAIPEYAELTNKLTNKIAEKERITQQAENYRLGKSYETLADLAIEPRTVKDLKRKLTFAEKQLFPYLDKTPEDATLYDVNPTTIERLGLTELASQFMDDIVAGKIPVEQIGNISIPKYIQETAMARAAKEAQAKKDLAAQQKIFDTYLQEQVQQIPSDRVFGNAAALEMTSLMSEEELMRHMSTDTEILDHCVGQGGQGSSGRRYTPIVNPVTGEVNKGSSGTPTTYVRNVLKRGDIITSLRDIVTGKPVGTIELNKTADGEYDINYASGYNNGRMEPQYTESLKNYLNSKAEVIRGSGDNLTKNGIVDQEAMRRNDLRDITGLSDGALDQLSYDGLPRFLSREDIIELNNQRKAMLPSTQLNSEVATLNNSYADLLDESQQLNFSLQNADDDLVREELMSRKSEIQSQLQDIGQRITNTPMEDINVLARELINDVFPENKKTPRARLEYLDNQSSISLRVQPRVFEAMREILRDERDAVGAPLTVAQEYTVRQELNRISNDITNSLRSNTYNGAAVANNIRRNPDSYGLGEFNAQIIDGIARQVEERGLIDPRNIPLARIEQEQSTLPAQTVERLNNLFGNVVRGAADPNFEQAIFDLQQYQNGYTNPSPQSAILDLTELQRHEATGEIQRRIEDLQQRAQRQPLVNAARPNEQRQDLAVVVDRLHDAVAEDYGQPVADYVREAMATIRYNVATDAPLYIEQLRRMADNEVDPEVSSAMNMVANRLVQGERANIAAVRNTALQLAEPAQVERVPAPRQIAESIVHATDPIRTTRIDSLTEALVDELRQMPVDDEGLHAYVNRINNGPLDLPGPIERYLTSNDQRNRISDYLIQQASRRIDNLQNQAIQQVPAQDNGGLSPEYMTYLRTRLADARTGDDMVALERDFLQVGNPQGYSPAQIQAIEREIGRRSLEVLRDNQPIARPANNIGNVVQNLINQYPERNQIQALINDLERGEYSELPVPIVEADEIVRDDTVSQIIEQLEEYRNSIPAEREVRPNVRYGTNVMDAYSGILEDNDQFRTFESLDALRALPQLIRRPGATRNSLGIGQFSNEQANQLARIFDALYDARYQQFVREGGDNPQLPPPEGRKAGGSIQSSKNRLLSPNTDEMRLALLKGK